MTPSRPPSTTHARPRPFDPPELAPRVLGCQAIFLDYDGTLTPIVARPELAVLPQEVGAILRNLSASHTVTIVSGRDVEGVRQLVGLEHLGYVGSHGLDIVGPSGSGLRREVAGSFVPELDLVEAELIRQTEEIDGVVIERKRFSISTHVRQAAPQTHGRVGAIVEAVARAHPSLRREGGKMLYELRPDIDWDKGAAVDWLLDELDIDPATALYVGDDLTDETAFARLAGRGVTIVVADPDDDRPTCADYRLDSPAEVRTLLERLAQRPSVPPGE